MTRANTFRIAVRKFDAFESAIAKQWASFEADARTGLTLDAVPLDLHPLEAALFTSNGMLNGAWDVCFISTDWIAAMHAAGAALDLATLFAADPIPDLPTAWTDSLLRLQRIGDTIRGTPYHDGPECLIYRKDIFRDPANQAVYQHRFGQPLAPPKTWDEFHQIARFLHNPDESCYGAIFASFPDGHNAVYDFLLQLWSRGGNLLSPSGDTTLNTPQAADALVFYRNILTDTTAVHPRCQQLDSVQAGLAFAAGEAAMMVNWFGFAAMAHTAPDSKVKDLIDIAAIPHGPHGTSISLNVYWILSIAAGSPHPDIAWRFLKHCLTPAMDKLTTTEGAIGCRKSTWSDPQVNHAIPFYHRMESLHRTAREIPQLPHWPRLAAIIDALITATITTSQPIETLLSDADKKAAATT